nr:hypothetical protein [Paracoccus bogoriensis]
MIAAGPKECPNADDGGAALHLLAQPLDRVRAVKLGAVLAREEHQGQNVVLANVHQVGEPGPARAQFLGHLAPGLSGMGAIGLVEGLPERAIARP